MNYQNLREGLWVKKNILIVDDQPEIAELLRLYLEKEGYDVIEAHDGMDALMYISKGKIDLMLVDLMMPIIDGYQLIKKVRETLQCSNYHHLSETGRSG